MTDDLVKRLRDPSFGSPRWMDTMAEAADRIEALEAALRSIVEYCDALYMPCYKDIRSKARAALKEGKKDE